MPPFIMNKIIHLSLQVIVLQSLPTSLGFTPHFHNYQHRHNPSFIPTKHFVSTTEPPPRTSNSPQNDHGKFEIFESNLQKLKSGSDIRGQFLPHPSSATSLDDVFRDLATQDSPLGQLTPFSVYTFGYAFAERLLEESSEDGEEVTVCIGKDPRPHGGVLGEWLARGISDGGATVLDTGIATTPSMFEFCRSNLCFGAIMITASHLPADRNGLKFFTKKDGGFTKSDINDLANRATTIARTHRHTSYPLLNPDHHPAPQKVDYFTHYADTIQSAIISEMCADLEECDTGTLSLPLAGLRVVLNAGHGSGSLFYKILHDLGADVSGSSGITPDGTFPNGIPNPESKDMVYMTTKLCEECHADVGIMLDTDADRSGFVLPREVRSDGCDRYEPLNGNRLIALLGVIFAESAPGCTIVTDSVTSEGLGQFLRDLGLRHYRFVRGYANVISKAQELNEAGVDAQVAIETSGHCAMKENGFLDDGTYTAVKVLGFLAKLTRERHNDAPFSLLEYIDGMAEMEEVKEIRFTARDGTVDTTKMVFEQCEAMIENMCKQEGKGWQLDYDNMEGVRVRTTGGRDGSFFMIRRSLHDPVLSLYMEGSSVSEIKEEVVLPLLGMFEDNAFVNEALDLSPLKELATYVGLGP